MTLRPCLTCGRVSNGSRCPEHEREMRRRRDATRDRTAHRAVYGTTRWQKLSASLRRRWVAAYGPTCPGWQRPEHVVAPSMLTVAGCGPTFSRVTSKPSVASRYCASKSVCTSRSRTCTLGGDQR